MQLTCDPRRTPGIVAIATSSIGKAHLSEFTLGALVLVADMVASFRAILREGTSSLLFSDVTDDRFSSHRVNTFGSDKYVDLSVRLYATRKAVTIFSALCQFNLPRSFPVEHLLTGCRGLIHAIGSRHRNGSN